MILASASQAERTAGHAPASVGGNIVRQIIGMLFPPLAGLATAPMLARALGESGRGELAASASLLLLVAAVGMFGLQESLTFHIASAPERGRKSADFASWTLGVLGVLGAAITFLIAPLLAGGRSELLFLLQVSAVAVLPNFLLAIPRGIAAGSHEWKLAAMESGLTGIIRLVVIGGLWAAGLLTPLTALVATAAIPLLSAVVYVPFLLRWRRHRRRVRKSRDGRVGGSVLQFGLKVWLGALSGIVLTRLDQVLMVPLSGEAQLGFYAVAVTVGELPTIISAASRNVIFSADAAAGKDSAQALRLQQTTRLTVLFTALSALVLGSTMYWWLPFLFGKAFAAALPAAAVLLLATVAGTAGSVAGAGLGARGRPELRSLSMLFGAIANFATLIVLVPVWGALGAALSTLVGAWISGTANIIWLKRHFGMPLRSFLGVRGADLSLIRDAAGKTASASSQASRELV